jgi:hypothetical protein
MFIASPSDNDVICGRSRQVNLHIGNVRFGKIVQNYTAEY